MTRLRGNHSRSSNEPTGTVTYFCTGGAGKARAEAEAARTGLTWLPGGGHGPVAYLNELTGQRPGELRCPVCGLTKRIGYHARQRIRAAGLTRVDISALPF